MITTAEPDIAQLLLVLAQLPGIGPSRTNNLLTRFGPEQVLLSSTAEALMQVPGFGETLARETASRLSSRTWMDNARQKALEQIDRAGRLRAWIVTLFDAAYPPLLKEICDPPPLLFVRGNPEALLGASLAVVGTRKATSYGKQATELFCRDLVSCGFSILSGLAYGIDMTAHRTALDHGGTTIAVLGCGVDTIYTDPVGRLWPHIIEHGAIISEEWIGTEPSPGNFPRRNRLISGITLGTLVVESDIKGGSMITAACALEQNREVFAVPGSIFARTSRGTNQLIQQSRAKPVLSVEDMLTELLPQGSALLKRPSAVPSSSVPSLNPEETSIIGAIGEESLHIDLIAETTGLSIESLMVHLFELEMKRIITQEPGQLFRKRISGSH
ncbi:MAG: DNA-protecting protein DprA [Chlorobiaceae bacterium]|nr:DNA-protecting protein DprA [Chlorobiaceae bacterium]